MTIRDKLETGFLLILLILLFAVTIGVSTLATMGWWWLVTL